MRKHHKSHSTFSVVLKYQTQRHSQPQKPGALMSLLLSSYTNNAYRQWVWEDYKSSASLLGKSCENCSPTQNSHLLQLIWFYCVCVSVKCILFMFESCSLSNNCQACLVAWGQSSYSVVFLHVCSAGMHRTLDLTEVTEDQAPDLLGHHCLSSCLTWLLTTSGLHHWSL